MTDPDGEMKTEMTLIVTASADHPQGTLLDEHGHPVPRQEN